MRSIGKILEDASVEMNWKEYVQIIHLLGFIERLNGEDKEIRVKFARYMKDVVAEEFENGKLDQEESE